MPHIPFLGTQKKMHITGFIKITTSVGVYLFYLCGGYHIHIHDMRTSHDMTLQLITLQDEKGRKRPSHASYCLPKNIRNCTKSWLQWADCKRLLRVYLSDAKNSISRQDHVLILFHWVPSKPHLHPSCYLDNSRELKDHFFIFSPPTWFFFSWSKPHFESCPESQCGWLDSPNPRGPQFFWMPNGLVSVTNYDNNSGKNVLDASRCHCPYGFVWK